MGCQQSVPLQVKTTLAASYSPKKDAYSSHKQLMSRSERSRATSHSTTPSSAVSLDVDEEVSYELPKVDHNGNLLAEEIVRRTSTSLEETAVMLGCSDKGGKIVCVKYAYRSQRGYNRDDPLKPNQDKYGITLNLGGEIGDALLGVYDGHGEEGHHCATFIKKKLPKQLAKYIRQNRVQHYTVEGEGKKKGAYNPKMWPLLSKKDFEQCCHRAFLDTNKALREEKAINEKVSGTTAAVVCFHGGRMTVCNVGDSRIVLGHRVPVNTFEETIEEEKEEEKREIVEDDDHKDAGKNGELIAIPLTRDQTCFRRDERERIMKMGGEIKSIDQLEGAAPAHEKWGDFVNGEKVDIKGDPPRVWVAGKKYPGCAFTRSFGDSVAEGIGVSADPEIVTFDVTANDEILVIASDGVFEFLTNQQVINICAAFDSPLQASEAVTKAAYDMWIQHDNRIDDITIIVCFLSSTYKPSTDLIAMTTQALLENLGRTCRQSPPLQRSVQLQSYNRKASEIYATKSTFGAVSEENH